MFGDVFLVRGVGVEATPFLGMYVKIRHRKVSSMRVVWSMCCGARQVTLGFRSALMLEKRACVWKLCLVLRACFVWVFCVAGLWALGGCTSVCPNCPSVTFRIAQKLDACPNATTDPPSSGSYALILQFRLTQADGQSAQSGHAWILDKGKTPQSTDSTRVINNFFCAQGDANARACPCVELLSAETKEVSCGAATHQVVNGMNLVIAVKQSDLEGSGFQFQVTTASEPKDADLFVLEESLFPALLADGLQEKVPFSAVKWEKLQFSVKGYWRQDTSGEAKPKRVGVVKAKESVTFSPNAAVSELVKDETTACPVP